MSRYCRFYVTVALWIYDSAEFHGCYMSSVIGKCSVICILLYFSTNCVRGRRTLTLQVLWLIPRVSFWMPCDLTVWVLSWTSWYIWPQLTCVVFLALELRILWHSFTTRWNIGKFVFTTCLFILFLTVFNLVSFVGKAQL